MIYRLMDNTKVTMDSIIDSKGKYTLIPQHYYKYNFLSS